MRCRPGVANTALMDGNLLMAVDLVYKLWDEADLFKSVYNNQFVVQIGSQYSAGHSGGRWMKSVSWHPSLYQS